MDNKDIAKTLNKLLELLHDSHDGYIESAKNVKDSRLQAIFNRLANTRNNMIRALEVQLHQLGEDPITTGSTLAAAHRLFVDLKGLVTGGDPETIITEIKRGENYTLEHFRDALKQPLPLAIETLLKEQANEIEANISRIVLEEAAVS
jgi:uncharacterized protein (TIGR02284 family)